MRRKARVTVNWLLGVVLFFASWGVAVAQTNAPVRQELDELRLMLGRMLAENQELKMQAAQRETVVRKLQESLAVARCESELFQRKWTEAQFRVQSLGANPNDCEVEAAQWQLAETIRRLYVAEAEKQQLMTQLQRLIVAVQSNVNVAVEVEAMQTLLANAAVVVNKAVSATMAVPVGILVAAKILDVNAELRVAVLNVGAQQGARIGMPFVVVRGDRVVAELRVVEVRARICGALIERVDSRVTLKAGDAASVTRSTEGLPR